MVLRPKHRHLEDHTTNATKAVDADLGRLGLAEVS